MDIQLFCRECGSGVPLVLLHGNGEDSSYFEHQIAFFSASFRVLAFDTRGHGKSPRGTAPFSISRFADDLHETLCAMGISNAVLLGFSDGANIAMRFALRYPQEVIALVLNGGNLDASGVKAHVQIPIEIGYRIAGLFAEKSAEAKRNYELLGLMVHDPAIDSSELCAVSVPVLVIAGTNDMIKASHTRRIAAAIPHAKLTFIRGDHFIAAKEPAAFNEAVSVFFADAGLL